MKKFPLYLPVVYFLLSISGCKYNNEYQSINANNQFSISIPPWMKEDKSLKEGAIFQYANRFRNFYTIGEVYTEEETKKNMAEVMKDNLSVLRKSLLNPVVTDSTNIADESLKGVRVEIYGKMNTENIYFTEILFEGKSQLYHLSIWTRGEDRKLRFKDDINRIIASFKEI